MEISKDLNNSREIEEINVNEYLEAEDSIQEVFKPKFGEYTINPPEMPLSYYIALLLKKRRFVVNPALHPRKAS